MSEHYWIAQPAAYKNSIKPLLHQQMWLFGQDVVCPEGNLLYEYQFSHQRSETRGGSMYTLCKEDKQIVLWGWGIWYGQADTGAIFVNRYRAKPRFSPQSHLTQSIHAEKFLPPTMNRIIIKKQAELIRKMWVDLLLWLASYEAWVVDKMGSAWRKIALKPFPHAHTKLSAVDLLADEWQSLAEQSRGLHIKSSQY